MIEVLLSLFITFLIILSLTPIYRLISHAYEINQKDEDIYIAAKQVSQYLIGNYTIDCQNSYKYLSRENEEMELVYDRNRLVKKEGYEILLNNIDSAKFSIKEDNIFMTIQRNNKSYTFLVGYAREKDEEGVEEDEIFE